MDPLLPLHQQTTPLTVHPHSTTPQQDLSKKLAITQQTCLVEEKFSKNGVQKDVHVVVKNNPFILNLVLLDKQYSFHQFSTEIQLVYDCATLKEVDFVKLKPLECKTRPNDEGDQLTVEIRIKVLTSQLEDMFFRVVVKLVDPRTKKEYPHLVCLSHPIRVVSKPDQVKKKIKKRKRAPTDSLLDSINRIESQQREQHRLLKKLCSGNASETSEADSSNTIKVDSPFEDNTPQPNNLDCDQDDFRIAFSDFLVAFKQLQSIDTSDGSYKINTSAQDAQTMCEILELIRAEIKAERQESENEGFGPACPCAHCPYKEKMEKISSSLYSAVPDTTISASCNIPIVPTLITTDSQVQAPVVSTDVLDNAMGNLFDINTINSLAQFHSLSTGVSSTSFNFPAYTADFNPLFTPPAI